LGRICYRIDPTQVRNMLSYAASINNFAQRSAKSILGFVMLLEMKISFVLDQSARYSISSGLFISEKSSLYTKASLEYVKPEL